MNLKLYFCPFFAWLTLSHHLDFMSSGMTSLVSEMRPECSTFSKQHTPFLLGTHQRCHFSSLRNCVSASSSGSWAPQCRGHVCCLFSIVSPSVVCCLKHNRILTLLKSMCNESLFRYFEVCFLRLFRLPHQSSEYVTCACTPSLHPQWWSSTMYCISWLHTWRIKPPTGGTSEKLLS